MSEQDQHVIDQFIITQLRDGVAVRAIERALQENGWTVAQIDASLLRVTSVQPPQSIPKQPEQPKPVRQELITPIIEKPVQPVKHESGFWGTITTLRKVLIIGFGILLLTVSSTAIILITSGNPSSPVAAATSVRDANYNLALPEGWTASQHDISGAGMRLFQQGAGAQTYARVYVYPTTSMSIEQHLRTQQAGLEQAQAKISDYPMPAITDNVSAALKISKTTLVQLPNGSKQYYLTASVTYKQVLYVMDVVIPEGNTDALNRAVPSLLKGFEPLSETLQPAR